MTNRCLALATLVLTGCATHAPQADRQVAIPTRWEGADALAHGGPPGLASTQPGWPDRDWWRTFGDTTLNELEQTAGTDNYDIKAASSRIAEARDAARIAAGSLFPSMDGAFRAQHAGPFTGSEPTNPAKSLLTATYDTDPWGRLRNLSRAAQADALAASEARANVALNVSADVATAYFQLAAFDERIDLVHQTINTAQRTDELVETRYQAGAVSELDRAQSRTSLVDIQSGLPPLEQGRRQTAHALAILTGKPPTDFSVQPPPLTHISLPAALPIGLPSELLQRRPDIRQAEDNLAAAHADIAAARASLFPSILLTGQGGYASDELSSLIRASNGAWSLGVDILAPIFHGGALRANLDKSKQRYDELLQEYYQTILGALRDVEDALVAVQKLTEQEALLVEARNQAQRAFELAEIRYRGGATDATTMLTTQSTWLNLQDSVLRIRFARAAAFVSLYKALGGGSAVSQQMTPIR